MKLSQIELREINMRLKHPFETSFGVTQERRILLVTVRADGLEGVGEVTCNEGPGYSYETTDTAWHLLRDWLIPSVLGKEFSHPSDLEMPFRRFRGHQMAKAGLETALWDWFARASGVSLAHMLGGVKSEVPVGVSVGIRATPEGLGEDVLRFQAAGYRRIKLKIAPGRDLEFVRRAREVLDQSQFSTPLTVDANSSYTLADAPTLAELDQFGLQYIEQPLAHDDLIDHATLARGLKTPICLDESIHHSDDARKAHSIDAGRVINLKLGRVGGHLEAKRIAEFCAANGLGLWCGGMLESGVGRAHNLAMQSQAAFNLASDTAPSSNYWHEDIIEPEITMRDGLVTVPSASGIGVVLRKDYIETLTTRVESYRRDMFA